MHSGKPCSRKECLLIASVSARSATAAPECRPHRGRASRGRILKWDAAERATSYQVSCGDWQFRGAGADKKFTEHYGGESTECPAPPAPCIVKVRARNANGFGKYSEEAAIGIALGAERISGSLGRFCGAGRLQSNEAEKSGV